MRTSLLFLLALFISSNVLSQKVDLKTMLDNPDRYTRVKKYGHGYFDYYIDTTQIDTTINILEYHQTNVLLLKRAIYKGYAIYVPEQGAFRSEERSYPLSPEYGYYINLNDWNTYLQKNEPNFDSNLNKFKNLTESSKQIYRSSYEEKLVELQVRESKETGRYSYERAVIVAYLCILDSEFIRKDTGVHYPKDANSDTKWYERIENYNLIEEIEKTIKIKENNDIDQIVELNEKLNGELEFLTRYKEVFDYINENSKPISLEEYDSKVEQYQQDFPGVFTNEIRLKNDRDNHIEELKLYTEICEEYSEIDKKGHFTDLNFKMFKIDVLKRILSDEDNGKSVIDMYNFYQIKPKAYTWKGSLLTLLPAAI